MAKSKNMTANELDKYYGSEPTDLDVELNELEVSLVRRELKRSLKKSREAQGIATILLKSENLSPDEIISCFRGIRYCISNPPRYWNLSQSMIDDVRETLADYGIGLSGGIRWIS